MKKLLFTVLLAALAIPMMQAQRVDLNKYGEIGINPNAVLTPLKAFDKNVQPKVNMTRGTIMFDFDSEETFGDWQSLDYDGDGNGWNEDNINGIDDSHCLVSVSWDYNGAYDPDNWLISAQLPLDGTLSIWAKSYSNSFRDNFAVYVCVGEPGFAEDFVLISASENKPGNTWTEYTFDLSEFQGQMGCFAIRHYNSYNQYRLFIDNISISSPEPMPEIVRVTPTSTKGNVTWTDENHDTWNLRYRPVNQNPAVVLYENDFEDNLDGWTLYDSDGDNNNWGWYEDDDLGHSGNLFIASTSWTSSTGALSPDNWIISPEVTLDGNLSFYARTTGYNDVIAVYVITDLEDEDSWVEIIPDFIPDAAWNEYTYDLSEFQGQTGYVAFRHHNCYNEHYVLIDDISIVIPGDEDAEWIEVDNLTETHYRITGLDPETEYEVQVQAVGGNWTDSYNFTTTKSTAINEVSGEKTVANVRYFNAAGQEMQEANGMTIVVTTYTDGTTSAVKVMK